MLGRMDKDIRHASAMSDDETGETNATERTLASVERRDIAVRREGALTVGVAALGALALGAVAVGAMAIGKLAIGELALGRAKLRSGQVDELRIARLTIAELVIERMPPSQDDQLGLWRRGADQVSQPWR